MSREGPLTSWGGILPRSELRVCVTGFRDASPPHADSALVWTDRWGSMKARAFSLAIHGHYLNYQKAPSTNKNKTLLLLAYQVPTLPVKRPPKPRHKPAEDTTYLNLTKRGLGHNAPRGEAITQLGAT